MELFDKLNKVIDKVTDALVDEVPDFNESKEYSWADLVKYVKKMKAEYTAVKKITVAVEKKSDFGQKIFSSERFVIRIVLLDENGAPLISSPNADSYLGTIVIAEAIDAKLKEKMGDHSVKTMSFRGGD